MKKLILTSILIGAMVLGACSESTPSTQADLAQSEVTALPIEVQLSEDATLSVSDEAIQFEGGQFVQGGMGEPMQGGAGEPMQGGAGGEPIQLNMVMGRVKSIVGNSVELELANMDDERMGGMIFTQRDTPDPNSTPDPNRTIDPNRTPMVRGEMPEGAQPGGQGGQRPESAQRGEGGGQGGRRAEGGQGNQRFGGGGGQAGGITLSEEPEYTGETAYYILPVGMQIGSGDYTTLTAGTIIMLMLNEDEEVMRASVVNISAN